MVTERRVGGITSESVDAACVANANKNREVQRMKVY